MHATLPLLKATDFPLIRRRSLETLQLNLGYTCNQTCVHCHVNAGPHRTEQMDEATIELVLQVLAQRNVLRLDLTGGAPELNRNFRSLVSRARQLGGQVMDRCNLTILFEPGQQDLAEFLASEHVEVVASLPCYQEDNVDKQRGKGVFEKSIRALQRLNQLGYGQVESLPLSLVYNPQNPVLPPGQKNLEADYRRFLSERFGIVFTRLYVLANMPIARFGSTLVSKGTFASYMALLRQAHQPSNIDSVMCRSLISVSYDGQLYDCDFNQMLGLPLRAAGPQRKAAHLRDLLDKSFDNNPIAIADHCYGCTAGQGSSCGGALA